MLGGEALFFSLHPSCNCSVGAGGFRGQKQGNVWKHAGVHMDLCGYVQVHVELSPDGQDTKDDQTLTPKVSVVLLSSGGAQDSRRGTWNITYFSHTLLTREGKQARGNKQSKREGLHLCESMPGVQKLTGLICIQSLSLGWLCFIQSLAKFSLFLSLSRQSRLKTSIDMPS